MTRNFQPAISNIDDVHRTQAQQDCATIGDSFANEAVENQRPVSNKNNGWGFPNPVQEDALVFTVLDDLRLYGSQALDIHYAEQQYDPYSLYKKSLFGKSDNNSSDESAA